MFERVLVANRGEIVVRIARTLRRLGCSPATLRARDDPARSHVLCCDVAVEVDSYLDVDAVIDAARRCGAGAVHPGYGFLAERAELARACEAAGLVWIGPPAEAIALMGDKPAARDAARRNGVAVLPGVDAPSAESVAAFAQEHGLPVLIKAAAGGGGKGMRVVGSLHDIASALESARREAAAAFGDGALLVERLVTPARHLELQLLADAYGNVLELGERECSLQRRHQKVIEETPSPVVDASLRATMGREAVALARSCGYVGAGTVEFVADAGEPARHYFLEMNTRLQVEHAVTEEVYGIDLVEWQLRIAAGERLPSAGLGEPQGHAIEVRICAEDPARGFLPATGTIRALRLPQGEGIRVDSGVMAGESIGTGYDPMIAKVIAHGATREEALERLRAAVRETTVAGLRTNVGFLGDLIDDPRFREGRLDTGLVEGMTVPNAPAAARRAALVALVAHRLDERRDSGGDDPFVSLAGWRLTGVSSIVPRHYEVDGGLEVEVGVGPLVGSGAPPTEASIDGERVTLALLADMPLDGGRLIELLFDGKSETWTAASDGEACWVGLEGRSWRAAAAADRHGDSDVSGHSEVRAPMPGTVAAVHKAEADEVVQGEVLLVIESMKMELQITAPANGTLAVLNVAAGDHVAIDQVLASITAHDRGVVP